MTTERVDSDLAGHPGELLIDELAERKMSLSELARQMGRPVQAISEIAHGKKRITAETALQLETVLGIKAYLWTGLQSDYELTIARQRQKQRSSA